MLGIPALMVHGVTVDEAGAVSTFSTDDSWKLVTNDGTERPAMIAGRYGDQPWGYWQKKAAILDVMPGEEIRTLWLWLATVLGATGGLWLLWRTAGWVGGGEPA